MMSLWDALRMNMMISYQELVRTFLRNYNACVSGLYSAWRGSHAEYMALVDIHFLNFWLRAHGKRRAH